MILCDIDYFKRYNDTYGHQQGDDCLKKIALALQSVCKRSTDLVARYGGEEFTVILFETGHADSWELAERVRTRVQEMRMTVESGALLGVTVSIGIAEVRDSDNAPGDLLQRADAALYQAKRAGRNCVCLAGTPVTDTAVSIGRGQ